MRCPFKQGSEVRKDKKSANMPTFIYSIVDFNIYLCLFVYVFIHMAAEVIRASSIMEYFSHGVAAWKVEEKSKEI